MVPCVAVLQVHVHLTSVAGVGPEAPLLLMRWHPDALEALSRRVPGALLPDGTLCVCLARRDDPGSHSLHCCPSVEIVGPPPYLTRLADMKDVGATSFAWLVTLT